VKLRQRQRGQLMLIILGTLFLGSGVATGVFVSGKSIKSIRKEVSALQLEAERQAQVYRVLEQWEAMNSGRPSPSRRRTSSGGMPGS
jgi:hypothetical protein